MEKTELTCFSVFNELFLSFRIVVVFVLFIEVPYNPLFNIRLTKLNYPLECEIRKSNVSVDIIEK